MRRWNCSETALKLSILIKRGLNTLNWLTHWIATLELLWNCSETALKLLWNELFNETAPKLHWNCSETALKLLLGKDACPTKLIALKQLVSLSSPCRVLVVSSSGPLRSANVLLRPLTALTWLPARIQRRHLFPRPNTKFLFQIFPAFFSAFSSFFSAFSSFCDVFQAFSSYFSFCEVFSSFFTAFYSFF